MAVRLLVKVLNYFLLNERACKLGACQTSCINLSLVEMIYILICWGGMCLRPPTNKWTVKDMMHLLVWSCLCLFHPDVLGCRAALTVANLARTRVIRRCVGTETSSVCVCVRVIVCACDSVCVCVCVFVQVHVFVCV